MDQEKKKDDAAEPEKSGVRPAQVAAAALAAVTAAFLGSSLGVYGTVLGAGLISVVTTVGSELYLRSLERTRAAARALSDVRTRSSGQRQRPGSPRDPGQPGHARQQGLPGHSGQPWLRGEPQPSPAEAPTVPALPLLAGDIESRHPWQALQPRPRRQWWRRRWPVLLGSSALAFVIGMVLITGYEGVTGKAISGNGSTTVSGVVSGADYGPKGGYDQQRSPDGPPATSEQPTPTQPTQPGDRPEIPAPTPQQPGEPTDPKPEPTETPRTSTGPDHPASEESVPPPTTESPAP